MLGTFFMKFYLANEVTEKTCQESFFISVSDNMKGDGRWQAYDIGYCWENKLLQPIALNFSLKSN